MKTLVIHPFDRSTDFLSTIWKDKGFTMLRTTVSKSKLADLIKSHDRIIMIGHGTDQGLLRPAGKGFNGFIIDSRLVYLLRDKDCVCIWCNADKFVDKYKLKGIFTGMIVSDFDEAYMFCVDGDIKDSNTKFAHHMSLMVDGVMSISDAIDSYNSTTNGIIQFNRNNIYIR